MKKPVEEWRHTDSLVSMSATMLSTQRRPVIIDAPKTRKRRIVTWWRGCWAWWFLVLFYMLATSKRVPPEAVPAMIEHTQLLMGIATLPLIARVNYVFWARLLKKDWNE